MAPQVNNPTYNLWGCGFDPWPCSVGEGSWVAMSGGVSCRCSSDLVLTWLWCRLQLQLWFNPSPRNFHMLQGQPLKTNKHTNKNEHYTAINIQISQTTLYSNFFLSNQDPILHHTLCTEMSGVSSPFTLGGFHSPSLSFETLTWEGYRPFILCNTPGVVAAFPAGIPRKGCGSPTEQKWRHLWWPRGEGTLCQGCESACFPWEINSLRGDLLRPYK